ncbi:hypothetical protein QCA50_008838 [Cerrena zonata]|uniref:Uncharacterized protein n=1 Tax=Cerrena zonata TaxID=2478898 RepID=A0AAW0GBV9_9APHY
MLGALFTVVARRRLISRIPHGVFDFEQYLGSGAIKSSEADRCVLIPRVEIIHKRWPYPSSPSSSSKSSHFMGTAKLSNFASRTIYTKLADM